MNEASSPAVFPIGPMWKGEATTAEQHSRHGPLLAAARLPSRGFIDAACAAEVRVSLY